MAPGLATAFFLMNYLIKYLVGAHRWSNWSSIRKNMKTRENKSSNHHILLYVNVTVGHFERQNNLAMVTDTFVLFIYMCLSQSVIIKFGPCSIKLAIETFK